MQSEKTRSPASCTMVLCAPVRNARLIASHRNIFELREGRYCQKSTQLMAAADSYPGMAVIDQNKPCNLPDFSGTNQDHSLRSVGKWNQPLSIKAVFCWWMMSPPSCVPLDTAWKTKATASQPPTAPPRPMHCCNVRCSTCASSICVWAKTTASMYWRRCAFKRPGCG
ncbi:hypothetical protein D3C87_1393740 [compost metagenome]